MKEEMKMATKRKYYIRFYNNSESEVPIKEVPYSTDSVVKVRRYVLKLIKNTRYRDTVQINTRPYDPRFDPYYGLVGQIQHEKGKWIWVYQSRPSLDICWASLHTDGTIGAPKRTYCRCRSR